MNIRIADYDYELPPESIAQQPVEPRDSARLLDTRTDEDFLVSDLPALLRPGDLVVTNHTRVRQARLFGKKTDTGGAVEVLLLARTTQQTWEALVRPARRISVGTRLSFGDSEHSLEVVVTSEPVDGKIGLSIPTEPDPEAIIALLGQTPLPPYITDYQGPPERYQTVFARSAGSAAAPTAGLHFTSELIDNLLQNQIEMTSIDLAVGWDTFRPITTDTLSQHQMHGESFDLSPETAAAIDHTRDQGGKVVAIGTTVVRVLETLAIAGGRVLPGRGETRLFLYPGQPFRVVDLLLTNFHIPRSTLLLLLAGFMGEDWREKYQLAQVRNYRFLSFGDAMLAERQTAE